MHEGREKERVYLRVCSNGDVFCVFVLCLLPTRLFVYMLCNTHFAHIAFLPFRHVAEIQNKSPL